MSDVLADIKQALAFVADGGTNQKWFANHDCAIIINVRKKKIICPLAV